MKPRYSTIIGFIAAVLIIISWRADVSTLGQDAPNITYQSPVGQFTLPTTTGTAGTLGIDYQLASLEFFFPSNVPQVGDLAGDTGNGFNDRYDFENLSAFNIPQAANLVGDLDSLDPANAILVGGRIINPGFRFVHVGLYPYVWRVGGANDNVLASEITAFTSIDHLFDPEVPGYGPRRMNPPPGGLGNAVLEAVEFTVFGTNDRAEAERAGNTIGFFGQGGTGVLPNSSWFRATLTRVYTDGFKDYNGKSPLMSEPEGADPSPQEGDDFASQWQFRDGTGNPVQVKYVAVYANRTRDQKFFIPDSNGNIPGNLAQSNECEIDAIAYVPSSAPQLATISGRVIDDANANGRIDPDERPIPGVTITLTGGAAGDRTTTTDASGAYRFEQVLPGSYRVIETNLPGYIDTGVLPGDGNTAIDLNTIAANLTPGRVSIENNFLDTLPPVTGECTPACFNNVDIWLLFDGARRAAYDSLGGVGGVFILSLNRGAMSDAEVVTALSGFDTPQQRLEAQFVAAQLNAAAYPRSIFNRASCFFNGPNVIVTIPGDPRFLDLLNQARSVFSGGDQLAIDRLARSLELINNVTATRGIICPFADP